VQKLADRSYLRSKAGDEEVRVEIRSSMSERFGKGQEIKMKFADFLDKIEQNEENYYLTTQELSYSAEDQPSIISPPLSQLRSDFPLIPKLMGNLVTQNINLWYGSSRNASSSGLHHDFHDNLYLVLKGEKSFHLFAPSEHSNIYTVGKIAKIHPNGRINYEGQLTNADGSDLSASLALQASQRIDLIAGKLMKVSLRACVFALAMI
jgi:hypothetical protein